MNESNAPATIHNAPVSHVGDHSPQAVVNDRTGLFIAIIAIVLGAFGCGMGVTVFAIMPSMIDAKVEAGVASARAEMEAASTNARLALDRADKTAAALEARGLIKLENH